MAKSGIEIRGLNQLQRVLLNAAPRAKRDIQELTEATGRLIESEAKGRAPVDTGKLRQSITFTPTKGGLGAEISANAPYWAYVEFGTGGEVSIPVGFEEIASQFKGKGERTINRPAQPFLIPAFLKYRDLYYKAVADRIAKIFRL